MFTARLRGQYSSCISRPLPPASATVSAPRRIGTCVITDDPTQMCHHRVESTVHSRVTPGVERLMGSDKRMTRTQHECHAEKSQCPKSPLSSTCALPPQPCNPDPFRLLSAAISRMSPSWNHTACCLLTGLLSLTNTHRRLRSLPVARELIPSMLSDSPVRVDSSLFIHRRLKDALVSSKFWQS